MRYLVIQFALCLIGSWSITVAYAQETELEVITVIGDTEPEAETGDVQLNEHTGSHQRIDRTELARQDVNLGDILANETGVQFRQIGGLGTLTTISLRAASTQQTNIYLDGILLNSAGNSTVDLSLLELLSLDSVDIYRGASPSQLSNGNIGGAVNLRSMGTSTDDNSTSVALNYGSFNTNRLQLTHRSSHGPWDIVAATSREQSNNRFPFTNDNATPLNAKDDRRELRNNAQTAKLSALARAGLQWNENTRSDFLLQATDRNLGIPEWLNNDKTITSYDTQTAELQWTNRFNNIGNWNTALTLYQHHTDNRFLDELTQVTLRALDTKDKSKTTGVKSYWEHIGDKGTFSLNTEIRSEALSTEDRLYSRQNFKSNRRALSAAMSYALFISNDKLLITPTIRIQNINDRFNGISRSNVNKKRDTTVTTQIGARYHVNDQLVFRSNVGQYLREPSFSELFSTRGLIFGNNNLLPDDGINADVGFTWTPSTAYKLDASLFGSWRDELIVLTFNQEGIGRSANTGKANAFGIELGQNLRFNKHLSGRLNTTYQLTQNFSGNPALNKNELPGEARLTAHARLKYKYKQSNLWIETNYKSDYFYDKANVLAAPGYWIHNAGIEHDWKKFKLGFTANNLSNVNAEDFNGYARPGVAYFFSITYRL